MSKFHDYSVNNCMLIFSQKPDASYVTGYVNWKKSFKRQVIKGEKGIRILAPYNIKVKVERTVDGKKEEVERTITKFRMISVFDISQTEGEPLPTLMDNLTGTSDNAKKLFKSIMEITEIPVYFASKSTDETLSGGAKGYYDGRNDVIVVDRDLDDIQLVKTLAHEYSHSLLHKNERKTQSQREIEAESLAFVVCDHFGVDTSEYSFKYIASYALEHPEKLKQTLLDIQTNAHELIEKIEPIFYGHDIQKNETQEHNKQKKQDWGER